MELWQQVKYANILSTQLNVFKVRGTNPFRATFRCPLCGDSKKNKNKARGNFVEYDNKLFYKCFNCSTSMSFDSFVKENFPETYSEMIFEKYKNEDKNSIFSNTSIEKKIRANPSLKNLTKISSLSEKSKAKKYIESRKIPFNQHYRIYYASKFNSWINSILPNKLSTNSDEGRIVFPILSTNKKLKGVSARTIHRKNFLTIMFDSSFPKVFGLDQVNFSKRFYVCESVIDSMFLPNSIALLGTESAIEETLQKYKKNCVIVLDNQPRNRELCRTLKNKYISNNFSCFIWNSTQEKDINELALSGYSHKQIYDFVNSNIYSGLTAQLKFQEWCKIKNV